MFNLHDLYATDVVPIRCNSNTVHSFVIRFAPQVVTEICFTVRVCLENSLRLNTFIENNTCMYVKKW